jgi:hypothetical protein
VRQKDPALKRVVEQPARGDVRDAMEKLDTQGRVHQIVDREERLAEIAREYATKPEGALVASGCGLPSTLNIRRPNSKTSP